MKLELNRIDSEFESYLDELEQGNTLDQSEENLNDEEYQDVEGPSVLEESNID